MKELILLGLVSSPLVLLVYNGVNKEVQEVKEIIKPIQEIKKKFHVIVDEGVLDNIPNLRPIMKLPSPRQIKCLASNIYHEASIEPLEGKIAVAHATLERVKSSEYPNTICNVVYQKNAMSWTNRKHHNVNLKEFYLLAKNVIMGKHGNPPCKATNWYNVKLDKKESFNAGKILQGRASCTYKVKNSNHVFLKIEV